MRIGAIRVGQGLRAVLECLSPLRWSLGTEQEHEDQSTQFSMFGLHIADLSTETFVEGLQITMSILDENSGEWIEKDRMIKIRFAADV